MARALVDKDLCIACGLCASICPKVFRMGDEKAEVIDGAKCDGPECKEAADACPTEAIKVE